MGSVILVTYVLGTAALICGLWILRAEMVKHLSAIESIAPLLQEVAMASHDISHALKTLEDIARQFQPNQGHTLLDVLNRLDTAAIQGQETAEDLKVGVREELVKTQQDREQIHNLLVQLHRIVIKIDAVAATGTFLQNTAVALGKEVAAAQERADATEGDAGAAADAAAQSGNRKNNHE